MHTIDAPAPHTIEGAAHGSVHTPATQLCPAAHALPQEPQWAVLVAVFTHDPPQET